MSGTLRKWLTAGLVVTLAALAVTLSVLASQRVSSSPVEGEVAPVPTFSEQPTALPSPASTQTSSNVARSEERFVAVGQDVIWRGIAGDCGVADPLIERSDDEGATWSDVTPRYLGVAQVMIGRTFSADQAELVAAMGGGCEVQALRTFTDGQFWANYDDVLGASTYIDPTDASRIISPDGILTAPCPEARALSTNESFITLTCDGAAYVTSGVADWTALPVQDAIAVTIDGDEVVVAHATSTCDGVALTWFDGVDAASAASQCAAGVDASAATAIAVANQRSIVWAGDDWVAVGID